MNGFWRGWGFQVHWQLCPSSLPCFMLPQTVQKNWSRKQTMRIAVVCIRGGSWVRLETLSLLRLLCCWNGFRRVAWKMIRSSSRMRTAAARQPAQALPTPAGWKVVCPACRKEGSSCPTLVQWSRRWRRQPPWTQAPQRKQRMQGSKNYFSLQGGKCGAFGIPQGAW